MTDLLLAISVEAVVVAAFLAGRWWEKASRLERDFEEYLKTLPEKPEAEKNP